MCCLSSARQIVFESIEQPHERDVWLVQRIVSEKHQRKHVRLSQQWRRDCGWISRASRACPPPCSSSSDPAQGRASE